mmetsp:Transcript_35177/g.87359  ORF Transcript_35177/g.87359 Transcript_35177/m.87359 type:complete len:214 (-) Transcript_35177:2245-2886(-)
MGYGWWGGGECAALAAAEWLGRWGCGAWRGGREFEGSALQQAGERGILVDEGLVCTPERLQVVADVCGLCQQPWLRCQSPLETLQSYHAPLLVESSGVGRVQKFGQQRSATAVLLTDQTLMSRQGALHTAQFPLHDAHFPQFVGVHVSQTVKLHERLFLMPFLGLQCPPDSLAPPLTLVQPPQRQIQQPAFVRLAPAALCPLISHHLYFRLLV